MPAIGNDARAEVRPRLGVFEPNGGSDLHSFVDVFYTGEAGDLKDAVSGVDLSCGALLAARRNAPQVAKEVR